MTAGKLLLTRSYKSICRLFVPVHLVMQADLSHFPVPPSSGPTFHNRARMAGYQVRPLSGQESRSLSLKSREPDPAWSHFMGDNAAGHYICHYALASGLIIDP